MRHGDQCQIFAEQMNRKGFSFQEFEILSMISRYGGPIRMDWIVGEPPGDGEDPAQKIRKAEKKSLIKREWQGDLGSYMVSTPFQGMVNE
jgi:hypothetical protein